MAAAQKFYGQLLPALGFTDPTGDDAWRGYQFPGDGPEAFFGFELDASHRPNETRIAFWAESRAEVDRLAEIVRQAGGLNVDGRRWKPTIRPVTTPSSSTTRAGTSSRFVAATVVPLEIAGASARRIGMSDEAPIPKMLRPQRRARYLKMIAIFKILQGMTLLGIGTSLLFLHSRTLWLDAISDWVDGELMVAHSRTMLFFLNSLQNVVTGGLLQMTGLIALFTALVLCTVGVGVYFQKHWAELLLVMATAALIPFEVRHAIFHPGAVAIIILAVNCFIVWYLYRVLRRERREARSAALAEESEVVEVR